MRIEALVEEFREALQKRQAASRKNQRRVMKERSDPERKIARLVDAIADGTAGDVAAVADRLRGMEARLEALDTLSEPEPPSFEWHPKAFDLYKRKIADLQAALTADDVVRAEASEILRRLVDRIVAYPAEKRGPFDVEPHGHLAVILNIENHGSVGGAASTNAN